MIDGCTEYSCRQGGSAGNPEVGALKEDSIAKISLFFSLNLPYFHRTRYPPRYLSIGIARLSQPRLDADGDTSMATVRMFTTTTAVTNEHEHPHRGQA